MSCRLTGRTSGFGPENPGSNPGDSIGIVFPCGLRTWSIALILAVILGYDARAVAADWVRGGDDGTQTRWGLSGGLQFAISPAVRGPRGLIRVLSPTLKEGKYDLVNFIAAEPIVGGRQGLSELERSSLDGTAGKRFWVDDLAGTVEKLADGVERLRVVIHVEPFENGAKVRVVVEQWSDQPNEISLAVWPEEGCAAMEYCVLTATMGNKARARELWLKDEVVSSLKLFADYRGPDFAKTVLFPTSKLMATKDGEVMAAITTDEEKPADVRPFAGSNLWYWGGEKVTQYWKSGGKDVEVAVNGRFMYWRMNLEVPGGIAFENFEMRGDFYPGAGVCVWGYAEESCGVGVCCAMRFTRGGRATRSVAAMGYVCVFFLF